MDSFEINKLIGAFLATMFVVFSLSLVSDAIFAAPVPEKPGFGIEAVEEEAGGEAPAAEESVLPLLATADVQEGTAEHKKCIACHTVEKGGANKTGPNLFEIVNRPIASHEGFAYSTPMKEFSQGGTVKWDYEHLDKFLTSPKGLVKGTAMGFGGVKKTQNRANLIAYLRTLSDSPAALPEAAAPAAEGAAAPAGEKPAAEPAGGADKPAEGAAPAAPAEGAPAEKPAEGGNATTPKPEGGTAPAAPAEGDARPPRRRVKRLRQRSPPKAARRPRQSRQRLLRRLRPPSNDNLMRGIMKKPGSARLFQFQSRI